MIDQSEPKADILDFPETWSPELRDFFGAFYALARKWDSLECENSQLRYKLRKIQGICSRAEEGKDEP